MNILNYLNGQYTTVTVDSLSYLGSKKYKRRDLDTQSSKNVLLDIELDSGMQQFIVSADIVPKSSLIDRCGNITFQYQKGMAYASTSIADSESYNIRHGYSGLTIIFANKCYKNNNGFLTSIENSKDFGIPAILYEKDFILPELDQISFKDEIDEGDGRLNTICSLSSKVYKDSTPLIPMGGVLGGNLDLNKCIQSYCLCYPNIENEKTSLLFTSHNWTQKHGIEVESSHMVNDCCYTMIDIMEPNITSLGEDVDSGKITIMSHDNRRYVSNGYKVVNRVKRQLLINFIAEK